MPKPALLLVAHGTRNLQAKEEVQKLCESLKNKLLGKYSLVEYSFLELAQPSFTQSLSLLVKEITEIDVLPVFLFMGRHVGEDIPKIIQKVTKINPSCKVNLQPYLYESQELPALLLNILL